MKKILFSLILLVSVAPVWAQNGYNAEPYLVKNLEGVSIQNVQAKTSGGNIKIVGGSEKPRVEVFIQANHGEKRTHEEIKKELEVDYDMGINTGPGALILFAKAKPGFKDWNHGLSISFTVYVPSSVSTDLQTSGGNIMLSNLNGSQQNFSTSGGNLKLEMLSGNVKGKTSGGNIYLSNSNGEIDLITSGGNIEADHCKGNLGLKTSGGNVVMQNIKGNILANTSGGNIRGNDINGNLESSTSGGNIDLVRLSCTLEGSTSGGGMHIEMVSLGKFVHLHDSSGDIHISLPGKSGMTLSMKADKIHLNEMGNFNGTNKEGNLNGTLNGGGVPVTISNSSGTIQVELN